ncbi:MAG TPA: 2Fe-2S iron-sulfur cluster-binding protein [Phycisphaerae bacterium]|nr:2Fe-2S iron-sulfur cluster-binding protein [Phycisphaerae bacterium]
MLTITIDGRSVDVPPGATILEAARRAGIVIPTLCHRDDLPPQGSCMVCAVKLAGRDAMVPACVMLAEDGMIVQSETDEVRAVRRAALELLLSDHVGDCAAPCRQADEHHVDWAEMVRRVAAGDLSGALAALEDACPPGTPAGKIDARKAMRACRRGQHDAPLALDRLLRHVLDSAGRAFAPRGPAAPPQSFSVHMGRLSEPEMRQLVSQASAAGPIIPAVGPEGDYTPDEVRAEAARCLHCDCRAARTCALRHWAEVYGARPGRYAGAPRRAFEQRLDHPRVVFEPGKCIDCGLCVRICQRRGERLGLAFVGRGFDVRVGVPLGGALSDALTTAAEECVSACPTGALAWK